MQHETLRHFTYNPGNAIEYSMDRMRLELGDTTFSPGELTAALCDEEYISLIDGAKSSRAWKRAKIRCLKAILMKYAHQTTMSVSGLSYSFSDRVRLWKEMLDDLERENSTAFPSVDLGNGKANADGGHYFYKDMHSNHGKW